MVRHGYYRQCNMCGGEFAGPVGARRDIRHMAESCGSYYGHKMTEADRLRIFGSNLGITGLSTDPIWLWYKTARARDYLIAAGDLVPWEDYPWKPTSRADEVSPAPAQGEV